jgi:hypothetical protein
MLLPLPLELWLLLPQRRVLLQLPALCPRHISI